MKKPREILFARHENAAPKLEALRREILTELNHKKTKEQNYPASLVALFLRCSDKLWQELIFPSRRIWAGLAAIWILLFIVNFSQRDHSRIVAEKSSSAEMTMTFRDQQKLLNELFADRSPPADAIAPRIFLPKPRTETTEFLTA